MSNEETVTQTLRQTCRECLKPFTVDVPIKLWSQYRDGDVNIDELFPVNEWHWSDREIIIQAQREHRKKGWNWFYLCEHCMVKAGLAEPHETKRGVGIV